MKSKKYYKILGGNIPIMVSSPHSTATKRDGKTKDGEVMTGEIAMLLNKKSGVHSIIKNVESVDDPNYDKNSEYKKSLIGYIKRNGIKILLDIHGCSSDRDYDISIGTASQNGMDGLINGFKSVFKGYKIDINNDFKAKKNDTITKAISNATDCKCIQIEINKSLRKKDGDDFDDLVNTFVKFIKLQSMKNLKESMKITLDDIKEMVLECANKILTEGYLDDVYGSDNFMRWFSGSKMVDENGRPLLLGHATRSFGFNKFNTEFIHLSSVKDASYFSGGNRRFLKFKKSLYKLSGEEILDLYNKFFRYGEDGPLYFLDDDSLEKILSEYDKRISECNSEEYINIMAKYGISREKLQKDLNVFIECKNYLIHQYSKNKGKICCRPYYSNGVPVLTYNNFAVKKVQAWFSESFPSTNHLRDLMIYDMFGSDKYIGKGGTYALCARVVNPFHIDCKGNSWARIYVAPDNCTDYDSIFEKWNEAGLNKHGEHKGTWISLDNESIAYFAKESGYDGVVFHNIKEGGLENIRMDTTYIVFSTKQLKSPFENNGEFGDVENLFK